MELVSGAGLASLRSEVTKADGASIYLPVTRAAVAIGDEEV